MYRNDWRLTCQNWNCNVPIRFGTPACQTNDNRLIVAQSWKKIPQTPFLGLNSEVTGSMFTKFIYDVEALLLLLMRTVTKWHWILFRNARAKSQGSQFWRCKKTKLIGYHSNVPLATAELTLVLWSSYMYLPMQKIWWRSVQYLLRYLVGYADFAISFQKLQ